ncbi:MAG: hypothetical protein ACTSWX_09305 [Promethearchaeota archaeon]
MSIKFFNKISKAAVYYVAVPVDKIRSGELQQGQEYLVELTPIDKVIDYIKGEK